MNASIPKVTIPKLTPDEIKGLQAYWRVYETHREAINAKLMEMLGQHAEIKFIMQNMAAASPEQQAAGLELQRRAILHNDWYPYVESLRVQGTKYAEEGLSFQSWFDIVGAFRMHTVPYLLQTYAGSPDELLSAINGMDCLLDIAMSTIGNSYLETKQKLISEQGAILHESEQKFSIIFDKAAFAAGLSRMPDGALVNVNQAFERAFGYTKQEVLGKNSLELGINPDAESRMRIRAELEAQGAVRDREFTLHTKSGEARSFLVNINLVEIGGEKFILQTAQDITERKQAEEALRKSEERFAKAFHSSPDAIMITRLSDGLIIDANEGWMNLFGQERSEVLGQTSIELGVYVNPEDRKEAISRLEETGILRDFELEIRRKSGEIRQASLSGEKIEVNGTECLLIVIRDITERKQSEEKLRMLNEELEQRVAERTERLQHVNQELEYSRREMQSILDSMSTLNAKVALDGTLLFVNKIATQALGLPVGALVKTNFLEGQWWAFDSEIQERVKDAFAEASAGNKVSYQEKIFVFGRVLTINLDLTPMFGDDGQVEYILAEGRDISALKEAEKSLRAKTVELEEANRQLQHRMVERQRAEKKFRGLLESAPDAIIVVDEKGIIQLINTQTEKMFGYQSDELLGQSVEALVPKRFSRKHIRHREGYYVEHPARPMGIGLELFGLRKNGTEFPVEISLSPLDSEEGLLVSAAIRDVTQRKRTEEEIQRLNEDLKQRAAQLEASNRELESFSYSVSHDLRAPLRSIDGFSQALLEDYSEQIPPEGRDYLERVRSAAQRMGVLIDDLLNLSRITRATLQPKFVNLSAMAEEIVDTLHESQPERKVEVSIMPDLMVDGDPHLLRIALENLLSNAWKFTSKQEDALIEFGQQSRHNHKPRTFYVRDNGVGFDMAYVDKLFGVFQRLHSISQFPGTGVGLATVRRIVTIHGGQIWADSAEGKGATFYFTL